MYIRFGIRHYGTLWKLGEQALKTKFFHIWYIPLIPLGCEFVLETHGDDYRALPARVSLKSILLGYLRGGTVVGLLATVFLSIAAIEDSPELLILPAAVGLLAYTSFAHLGRLKGEKKLRAETRQQCVAISAEPSLLTQQTVRVIWEDLAKTLVKHGLEVDPATLKRMQPTPDTLAAR